MQYYLHINQNLSYVVKALPVIDHTSRIKGNSNDYNGRTIWTKIN
uniref:Uncharacterized protein n=1 Tax=Rhizophora mucronata TaxID=61149 RepID=A0A2P2NLF6_RHIMU